MNIQTTPPVYYVCNHDGTHTIADPQPVVVKPSISYEDYWDAQIKTLMEEIGYPESNSVYSAMKRFQMRIESYEVKL